MNITALRLYNKIRFTWNKKIRTCGKTLISPLAEIQAQGILNIGNGVKVERGAFIASRAGASMNLGTKVYINRNTCIVAKELITIGDYVSIGPNVCIYDHDHSNGSESGFVTAPITIGERVWIGANSTVLKGVTIGDDCVIAAGSVITHNVPCHSVVYQKRINTIVTRETLIGK